MTGGVPAAGWGSMGLVRCAVVIHPHRRQRRCASVGTREAAASLDASSGTFVLTTVETIARVPARERIPRGPRRSDLWISGSNSMGGAESPSWNCVVGLCIVSMYCRRSIAEMLSDREESPQ